jgi:hypothetical protein
MLNRPAKIATTGAALAVTSFGAGLFYNIWPSLFVSFLTGVGFALLVAVSSVLLVAYYAVVLLVIAAFCILCNPLSLLIGSGILMFTRIRKRLRA